LVATAVAYLWDLSASGYANSFYAAAVQAGTKSWKAFFFGSLDSSNFITVDKPPASLWVMELSGRIFGFSSLSMLVPEALMGVATVALVYAAVRRWHGPGAGLVAGLVMAITPVAALMFRFNNPDALLVMLLTAAAFCVTRALEKARTKWLMAAGIMIGFGFLAKMGEALLVVPAFALAYGVAAPTSLRRRLAQLAAAGVAMAVSAGWWVLIVALWPAGSRPMIDGSPTNSILNLILEYNGIGRIVGNSGGPGGGSPFSGAAGILRLFNSLMGGQASWLLPAALMALVGGMALTLRATRTDRARAALIIWGGWLVVAGAVFSLSQGVVHTYYTVALAPPIAALVGIGVAQLWAARHALWAHCAAAAGVIVTAVWAIVLLDRSPSWEGWLRPTIAVAAAVAVAGLAISWAGAGRTPWAKWKKRGTVVAKSAGAVACLAGPLAFTLQTVSTAHTGSVPSAGPSTSGAGGGLGRPGALGGGFPGGGTNRGGVFPGGSGPGAPGPGGSSSSGASSSGASSSGASSSGGGSFPAHGVTGSAPGSAPVGRTGGAATGTGGPSGGTVPTALVKLLEAGAGHYRWVAATDGSQNAASFELATGGEPVMAIGGFNNEGGNLSLSVFEHYVEAGDVHYYIVGGGGGLAGGPGGGGSSSAITSWVESHFEAVNVGGETIYDLASPTAR
jgi:4-amino-4-deoxy-L-arabinose transferase-like glycosyltransferase